MDDPATYSWVQMSNQTRHIAEYLAITGPDNVTRPMLAESWEASDDLKTWTFHLRQGVMWHNGEEFVADHVVWNVERWLNPDLGSSNIGLSTFASMDFGRGGRPAHGALQPEQAGAVGAGGLLQLPDRDPPPLVRAAVLGQPDRHRALHAGRAARGRRPLHPQAGHPDHRRQGVQVLGRAALPRRDPLLPLRRRQPADRVRLGRRRHASTASASSSSSSPRRSRGEIVAAQTAQTLCCRFKVTEAPFDNLKLRQALVKAADNTRLPRPGVPGRRRRRREPPRQPDPPRVLPAADDRARRRGRQGAARRRPAIADGLELSIDVGNTDGPWHQTVCEIWRDQLQDIGVTLNINVMPASKYWEIWDKTPFGATSWTHRPLGTMVLSLGYRTGVPWNEFELHQSRVRRRPRRRRGDPRRRGAPGQDGDGREDPAGRRRSCCSRSGGRCSPSSPSR